MGVAEATDFLGKLRSDGLKGTLSEDGITTDQIEVLEAIEEHLTRIYPMFDNHEKIVKQAMYDEMVADAKEFTMKMIKDMSKEHVLDIVTTRLKNKFVMFDN